MDTKKRQKLIRTLTDALYELFAVETTVGTYTPAPLKKGRKTVKRAKKTALKVVGVKPVKRRGPKKASKATPKPCPVTGILNTHRRYSYLMPEVRTPENLVKFKGGAKKVAA